MTNKGIFWKYLGNRYLTSQEVLEFYSNAKMKKILMIDLIKQRLFEDIWKRLQLYDEINPPIINSYNSKFLRCDRRARIVETKNIEHAKLNLNKNEFTIYVNEDKSLPQKRTLISHEIGHTFLYNVNEVSIEPLYIKDGILDYIEPDSSKLYKEEGFIYEIGRYLLIPSPLLKKYLSKNPLMSSFLNGVSENVFNVTKDLMARRLYWDISDWNLRSNYWRDSVLIMYPISKTTKIESNSPFGATEIFRGTDLKNTNVRTEIWPWLIPLVNESYANPEKLIDSENFQHNNWFKPIKIKGHEMKAELKYLPVDFRIYILIYPKVSSQLVISEFA
jgi:hypothetical protein